MVLEFVNFVPMLVGLPAGRGFGEFCEFVKDAIKKARAFKPESEEMKRTLESLEPLVKEIDRYNGEFDRPPEEAGYLIRKMEEGKELVDECLKVHKFNYYKKQSCTDKLRKFGESLKSYLQVDVQLQQSRDIKEIKEILDELKLISLRLNGQTSGVGHSDAPIVYRALCVPSSVPENPVGLHVPLRGLKMELFKDGVSVLILSAPPGCGKTSLAALLYYDEEVKERFKDNIFFITVSQNPNLQLIVERIFQHKNYKMPAFLGDHALDDMVSQLRNFVGYMNPKPLFILDDVWPESEFVLKKLDFRIPGYKVLVTSRYTFSNYSATFPLDPLDEKDAMILFCKLAGQSPDVPEEVLNNIVKACKRFPIALITVAGSLKGESAETWEIRASELSEIGSIFDQDDVLACLKKSLDALGNKNSMNECFMDLCAFPEDHRIPVTTLIDMWVELYKLDEKKFVVNLQNLAKRNLLDMVITRNGTSGSYAWHFVTQHDLLRELAIRETSLHAMEDRERLIVEINANNFPYWCREQKVISSRLLSIFTGFFSYWWREQKVISSRLLSISTDENFSSTWCNIQAPEVEVVVLNLQSESYNLPDFLANMDKLKVLLVANYGYLPAEISNFIPLGSLSNLKRIRLERISIPSCGFTSVKLQNLQKITLVTCNIDQAFCCDSTSNLLESLPNLVEMVIHCCYDLETLPLEICRLVKLQELSITDCHNLKALPEEIGNMKKLEVLRLDRCITLSGLPISITTLECLRVIDLSGCSDIEGLPNDLGNVSKLQKLYMSGCSKIQKLPETIENLEHLEEVICDEEANFLWQKLIRSMQKKPQIKVCKEESTLDFLKF